MTSPEAFNPRKELGLPELRLIADGAPAFIKDRTGLDTAALCRSIAADGLSYVLFSEKEKEEVYDVLHGEKISVYETKSLQPFLDKHKETLTAAGWPVRATDFVSYLFYVTPPANSAIFDLMHECYGGSANDARLRCNMATMLERDLLGQQADAEISLQRYKAFHVNDPAAAAWLLKAAAGGSNIKAIVDASRMYEHGAGLEKNSVEAAFWYGLAQKLVKDGKFYFPQFSFVDAPHFGLTVQQKRDVKKRIATWKPDRSADPLEAFESSEPFNPRKFFGLSETRHIGDYPVSMLREYAGLEAEGVYRAIAAAGLSYMVVHEKDMEEMYGAAREDWLWAYDAKDLQAFLDKNKDVLVEGGWLTQAADFADYLFHVMAPIKSEMFDLISECHGGKPHAYSELCLKGMDELRRESAILDHRKEAELTRQRFLAFHRNDAAAAAWLLKAARGGDSTSAMLDVSRMYEQGRGFEKNPVEAAFWYKLVQKRMGVPESANLRYQFARSVRPRFRLTQQQKTDIQKRLKAWKPNVSSDPLVKFRPAF